MVRYCVCTCSLQRVRDDAVRIAELTRVVEVSAKNQKEHGVMGFMMGTVGKGNAFQEQSCASCKNLQRVKKVVIPCGTTITIQSKMQEMIDEDDRALSEASSVIDVSPNAATATSVTPVSSPSYTSMTTSRSTPSS